MQQWLREADAGLKHRYVSKLRRKRIDVQQLLSACGNSTFLRGVVGMDFHTDDPAPDITLSHEDERGKPMTAKEVFRKLRHKFHGKKRGPKKEETRLK